MINIKKINREETLRYLGYGGEIPDGNISALIDECELKLLEVITPKYIYREFEIESISENSVKLKNCTAILTGLDITTHLSGCSKAILLCATLGLQVDTLIRTAQIEDMAKAVIYDALAGAVIEQVCNEIEKILQNKHSGFNMTWRFSPGYGDFSIEIQNEFLNAVNATKAIGVYANESMLLTPKKTVTAVIGLSEHEITKEKRGCTNCCLKDSCVFRKRGIHCG